MKQRITGEGWGSLGRRGGESVSQRGRPVSHETFLSPKFNGEFVEMSDWLLNLKRLGMSVILQRYKTTSICLI